MLITFRIKQIMKNVLAKMPSIFWVILIPIGIALFIWTITTVFFLLAEVEGFASILILIITIVIIRSVSYPTIKINNKIENEKSFAALGVAMGITFFAIMGMSVDQPGNFIYNKPLEIINCDNNTHLMRNVSVTNPLPGRTDITQGFYCVNDANEIVKEIDMFQVILVRFIEYVFIGYGLIYANKLYNTFKSRRTLTKDKDTKNDPLIQKF